MNTNTFKDWIRKYKQEQRSPNATAAQPTKTGQKRVRKRCYLQLEQLLIQYVELRGRLYVHDKCGLSYMYMKIKTLKWARQLLSPEAVATFSASDGWINATLAHYSVTAHIRKTELSGV